MLWTCADCACRYSVGAPCCPQCGSIDRSDTDMPKIHKDRPPTDAADLTAEPEPVKPEQPEPVARTRTRKAAEK